MPYFMIQAAHVGVGIMGVEGRQGDRVITRVMVRIRIRIRIRVKA